MINLRLALEGLELKDDEGRFVTALPHLVALALRIGELYQDGCQQSFGEIPHISVRNAIHLYKAAQLCESYGETPELFVAIQLRGMVQFSKLWVNGLASRLIHEAVKEQGSTQLVALRYYKAQLSLFSDRCRLYGPVLALEDEANTFSPLARYAFAHELGLDHIADAYAADAKIELANNPIARDVFGNRLEQLGVAAHTSALPPFAGADTTLS